MNKELVGAFAKGVAAGVVASPLTTEIYCHRYLAHRTFELHPRVRSAAWLMVRSTGFSPTPWAVEHRHHHGPYDVETKQGRIRGLLKALKVGYTPPEQARSYLKEEANEGHMAFPGEDPKTDPVVDTTGESTDLRYQNKADKLLDRWPRLARVALPMASATILYGLRSQKTPVVPKLAASVAAMAGFTVGQFGPPLVAAFPERRDGYDDAMNAGVDRGLPWQIAFGSYALHNAHHQAPHLSSPSSFDRDSVFPLPLEKLGLGRPHDGTTPQSA